MTYYQLDKDLKLKKIKNANIFKIIIIMSLIINIILIGNTIIFKQKFDNQVSKVININYNNTNDTTLLTKKSLWKAIVDAKIMFPEVVYKQAMAETKHLKSKSCTEANNLFGFKVFPSRYKGYHIPHVKHYDHLVFYTWIDCVRHYKVHQSSNFTKKYYYDYLKSLGYAEDPNYILLLKNINIPDSIKNTYATIK
jgi:hypothetical protein